MKNIIEFPAAGMRPRIEPTNVVSSPSELSDLASASVQLYSDRKIPFESLLELLRRENHVPLFRLQDFPELSVADLGLLGGAYDAYVGRYTDSNGIYHGNPDVFDAKIELEFYLNPIKQRAA